MANTIRGKVVTSSSLGHGESCESMYVHELSLHQKYFNHALINLLFGLCRSILIINPLVTHHNPHPKAPTRLFTPKVLWTKERTPIFYSSTIFIFRLAFESFKECGCVSIYVIERLEDAKYYKYVFICNLG
jgi:hypothetical protein